MEKVRSFGRSRSLGSSMKRLPFTSAPDPPELTDGDGFRWSTEVSKQRASPPRLAPSDKDTTERISSPTLRVGAKTPPTSPRRNKKKPGRTKRTLNALALLDTSSKHSSRSSTPDAPGYGEAAAAAPNIAQYQAEQIAGQNASGNGKPIRTLEIPTSGKAKKAGADDRSVLTDEMSNLHEHMQSKQRLSKMQDDDVSALSMGTAGREFYGWDAEGKAKSGAFGFGKKTTSPSRNKKKYGSGKSRGRNDVCRESPKVMLGAISESNEVAMPPQDPTANEIKAWAAAVDSTPPITNRKKAPDAKNDDDVNELSSPSMAASSRSGSPRYKKTGNSGATSPSRPSPKSHVSAHSSGELLSINDQAFSAEYNFADDDNHDGGSPAVDVLADLVADARLGNHPEIGRRSPLTKNGEMHDDVTMVRTNSQGHLARLSPDSLGPPKVSRYSQAIGSFDQSTDVATDEKHKGTKSPLYVIASYDSNDNSLLQNRLSFPPAPTMVSEGTPPQSFSGDEFIDAYQRAVSKYNNQLKPASPARSTKSSATAETAALSRVSTPANSPARSAGKPPSISNGSSSTGDKKTNSTSTGTGLKKLVRMPSLRKARSLGRNPSFKAIFSTTKTSQDNPEVCEVSNSSDDLKNGKQVDFIADEELAKRQEAINRRRSSFTNEESLEQNNSYDSLEDDDYTDDFNVVREIMEGHVAGHGKVRAHTFDTGYTGHTGGTVPSIENDVGTAIADLFCFNPLNVFDIDSVCHPTIVKATTGREPQTPMSDTASFIAVNNDQVPAIPTFG